MRFLVTNWLELRLILKLFRNLPSALLCIGVMVCVTLHMFAVVAVQVVGSHRSFRHQNIQADDPWNSAQAAMNSLMNPDTWPGLLTPLLDAGSSGFIILILFGVAVVFVLPNMANCVFMQLTMQAMNNTRGLSISVSLESKASWCKRLQEAFNVAEQITYSWFTLELDAKHKCVEEFCSSFKISEGDLQDLMYCLSLGGQRAVKIETLVETCLRWQDTPTKMDLLELFVKQQHIEEDQRTLVQNMVVPH
jgi:hypothetical protein